MFANFWEQSQSNHQPCSKQGLVKTKYVHHKLCGLSSRSLTFLHRFQWARRLRFRQDLNLIFLFPHHPTLTQDTYSQLWHRFYWYHCRCRAHHLYQAFKLSRERNIKKERSLKLARNRNRDYLLQACDLQIQVLKKNHNFLLYLHTWIMMYFVLVTIQIIFYHFHQSHRNIA